MTLLSVIFFGIGEGGSGVGGETSSEFKSSPRPTLTCPPGHVKIESYQPSYDRRRISWIYNGPQYETPAEIRAARILGADAVGMSTVTEALTAAHCGMPLLCLSVMTNMAAGVLDQPLTSEEVLETAYGIAVPFSAYLAKIIDRLGEVAL